MPAAEIAVAEVLPDGHRLEVFHRGAQPRLAPGAVNSPKRELQVFTPEEGATEHIGLDHLPHVGAFTADWIEDTLRDLDVAS